MAITSNEERSATRLADLERRLDALISLDRPGSQLFTPNTIPFGGANGALTTDSVFVWDNTNNRLGVNVAAPSYTLDVDGVIRGTSDLYLTKGSSPLIATSDNFDLRLGTNLTELARFVTTGEFQTRGINQIIITDAATTTTSNALLSYHRSSGTPGVGFGTDRYTMLDSATVQDRPAFLQRTSWLVATDATRRARHELYLFDFAAARLVLRMETSGSNVLMGFFGAAAVLRQIVTGVRTGTLAQLQTVVANILTALANEGLITDSTT